MCISHEYVALLLIFIIILLKKDYVENPYNVLEDGHTERRKCFYSCRK